MYVIARFIDFRFVMTEPLKSCIFEMVEISIALVVASKQNIDVFCSTIFCVVIEGGRTRLRRSEMFLEKTLLCLSLIIIAVLFSCLMIFHRKIKISSFCKKLRTSNEISRKIYSTSTFYTSRSSIAVYHCIIFSFCYLELQG